MAAAGGHELIERVRTTSVTTTGKNALMEAYFTVYGTASGGILGLAAGRNW